MKLSAVVVTKNSQKIIRKCLASLKPISDEIIVVDDYSKDKTRIIAKDYTDKVFSHHLISLGRQKQWGINKTKNDWVLLLDSDEIVSKNLRAEISQLSFNNRDISAYFIPFANHFLGRRLRYGGENYQVVRLVNKQKTYVAPFLVHEKIVVREGKVGQLKNKIYHYSYRSIGQVYKKFTQYAIWETIQKRKQGEQASLKKIFLYPLHMFWARFFKDKGYRDGLFRIPLDLGFAYMEFLTYFLLLIMPIDKK